MSTLWIIVLVFLSIYLLVGIAIWLWFGIDELKHFKKDTKWKIKSQVFLTTSPFILIWGWVVIIIIADN